MRTSKPLWIIFLIIIFLIPYINGASQQPYVKQFPDIEFGYNLQKLNDSICYFQYRPGSNLSEVTLVFYNINSTSYTKYNLADLGYLQLTSDRDTVFFCTRAETANNPMVFGWINYATGDVHKDTIQVNPFAPGSFCKINDEFFIVGNWADEVIYLRFDRGGKWVDTSVYSFNIGQVRGTVADDQKDVYIIYEEGWPSASVNHLLKVDSNGQLIYNVAQGDTFSSFYCGAIRPWGQGVLRIGEYQKQVPNMYMSSWMKIADKATGQPGTQYFIGAHEDADINNKISTRAWDALGEDDSTFIIVGEIMFAEVLFQVRGFAAKFDYQGNVIWLRIFPTEFNSTLSIREIARINDGYLFLAYKNTSPSTYNTQIIRTDLQGRLYSNSIVGHVDYSDDCIGRIGDLPQRVVKAVGNGKSFYGITNQSGWYSMQVETGSYQIVPTLKSLLEDTCFSSYINVFGSDTTIIDSQTVRRNAKCPIITANMAGSQLRAAMPGYYNFAISNIGTDTATSLSFDIYLDTFLHLQSWNLPIINAGNNHYTLEITKLYPGVSLTGSLEFEVDTFVPNGYYHHSYIKFINDTLCNAAYSNHSYLSCSGTCLGDSIVFDFFNLGASMTDSTDALIYLNDSLLLSSHVKLPYNQHSPIIIASENGGFYHAEIKQEPVQQLGASYSSSNYDNVWACGSVNDSALAYFNHYPYNPFDAKAEDVQLTINSFDPNDKSAIPVGRGPLHEINVGSELIYTIHFQNTGNAPAINVRLLDTLSPNLNADFFQVLSATHSYTYKFINERVVEFEFGNINLPDSGTNLAASQGSISFYIKPNDSLAPGTVITNKASIYFDFNDPVVTNTVFHTIEWPLNIPNAIQPIRNPPQICIFPNPTQDEVFIKSEIEGNIYFFNPLGQIVYSSKVQFGLNKIFLNGISEGLLTYCCVALDGKRYNGIILLH